MTDECTYYCELVAIWLWRMSGRRSCGNMHEDVRPGEHVFFNGLVSENLKRPMSSDSEAPHARFHVGISQSRRVVGVYVNTNEAGIASLVGVRNGIKCSLQFNVNDVQVACVLRGMCTMIDWIGLSRYF